MHEFVEFHWKINSWVVCNCFVYICTYPSKQTGNLVAMVKIYGNTAMVGTIRSRCEKTRDKKKVPLYIYFELRTVKSESNWEQSHLFIKRFPLAYPNIFGILFNSLNLITSYIYVGLHIWLRFVVVIIT